MVKLKQRIGLVLALIWLTGLSWGGERLSTSMGEILLRNLQPGTTYQLTPMLNFPFTLNYDGDRPITLKIDPSFPDVNEGKAGFDPIPDLSWIRLEPATFDIDGSSTVNSNVLISIPNDDSIRGKKYIVYLWAKVLGRGQGMGVGVGIKGRMLMTIAKEAETSEQNLGGGSTLNYKLDPGYVSLSGIRPGKRVRADKLAGQKFKVINHGNDEVVFNLNVITGDSLDLPPPQGSAWGDPNTKIKITPSQLRLKGGEAGRFKINLKIPDLPENYGKDFQYLVRVTPEGFGISSGILLRIQVKTVAENE